MWPTQKWQNVYNDWISTIQKYTNFHFFFLMKATYGRILTSKFTRGRIRIICTRVNYLNFSKTLRNIFSVFFLKWVRLVPGSPNLG
jgi:hypothetical protein